VANQRNTVQRQVILSTLKNLSTHPTIDEVYAEIYSERPAISKTTIYRNLRQLATCGTIRQVSLPDGLERYDGRTDPHYHFECRNCGGILDIDIEYLACINNTVQTKYDIQVDGHDVIFQGICQKCKSKE
jgi:Fe2+ or Zn2+ uptake regulation protein